jgi:hypothetical protein
MIEENPQYLRKKPFEHLVEKAESDEKQSKLERFGIKIDLDIQNKPTKDKKNEEFNFKLSQNEIFLKKQFENEHYNDFGCRAGFSFIFTPTGIGDNVIIRYNWCKEEKDITDYSSW